MRLYMAKLAMSTTLFVTAKQYLYTPCYSVSGDKHMPNLHLRMESFKALVVEHVYLIFGISTIHIDIC